MSIVACKITKDKITMAADTQMTCGDFKHPSLAFKKIVKIGDVVIGSTGTCSEVQLLHGYIKDNGIPATIKELQIFFSNFHKYRNSINDKICKNEEKNTDCHHLIVINDKVFFTNDCYIDEVKEFFSIGAGDAHSDAVLAMGGTVKDAVKMACRFSIYCGLPLQYIEIKKGAKNGKVVKKVLSEMFRVVGAENEFDEDFLKQEKWYLKHSWTQSQENSFQDWLRKYLRKREPWKHFSDKKLNSEIGYFMLNYGWRTGEEVDNGDKDLGGD